MTSEAINASLVAAHLTGHLEARIKMAIAVRDYDTAISHLKALTRAYDGNEFNQACHDWLRQFYKELEQYETISTKRAAR